MNKFWKRFCIILLSLLIVIDLVFVFGLPRFIDLNQYKSDIQQIAKEQADLDIDFENAEVITTPLFSVGAKINNISVKLPDKTLLFSADSIKTRVALPSIFLLTAKISCFEVENPFVNAEIYNDEEFKIVLLIEDILNKQKAVTFAQKPKQEEKTFAFNPAWIRIVVDNVKFKNYRVLVNDLNSGHFLELRGEELKAGYYNGKTAKFKTYAELYSDDKKNITANIDINTFLPPAAEGLDEEDDPAERIDFPFINPVTMYRNYDLKADADAKLYIRSYGAGDISSFGHFNVDGLTMKISHIQLPTSYLHAKTFKTNVWLDTNLNVTDKQNIKLLGRFNYGKHPDMDMSIDSGKIYFNDLIILSKALLDSLHIKNELNSYTAAGYIHAVANIKTNFKKLKSNGTIIVNGASLKIRNLGEVISNANINLLLNDNRLDFENSKLFLNGAKVYFEGKIDEKSIADVNIKTEPIPLPALFTAFAPKELRNAYNFKSGNLRVNFSLAGKLKKAVANADFSLSNLDFADKNNTFIIKNEILQGNLKSDAKTFLANVNDKNFSFLLPSTNSKILLPKLGISVNQQDVSIDENTILLNDKSVINYRGAVKDYTKLENIDVTADGLLNTADLVKFIGKEFSPFVDFKGEMPIKIIVSGDKGKQTAYAQILANGTNYITPVNIRELAGQNVALQSVIDFKPNRIKIKKTGFFTREISIDKDGEQVEHLKEVLGIDGTIAGDTINLIKINIPSNLNGKIFVFPKSEFMVKGERIFVYGQTSEPRVRGNFIAENISVPELLLSIDNLGLKFKGQKLEFLLNDILANGSDISTSGIVSLIPSPILNVSDVNVNSKLINVDKLMKVSDLAMKYVPSSSASTSVSSNQATDIPVSLRNSKINLQHIITGKINVYNTLSDISLDKNIFYINNLRTNVFSGKVKGDISMNLLSSLLEIRLKGTGINTEQALADAAGMKDTLSGKADFSTDIALKGATYEEQMKSLKGTVNFSVKDGSFGPFGKLENMILAENIRESEFFKTALGGVINSLATIDTTHFSNLSGDLEFDNGICYIEKLTSQGRILALHIFGSFNLLQNIADMKVRAKMTSIISDLLGPISMVNPVKLLNSAASMNVFTAKAFSLFCETVSQEELDTLPPFSNAYVDNAATKFQLVVRGDVAKPLSLVKSFKWLATPIEFQKAEEFVASIPDPVEGSTATTIDEVIKENQALEAEKKTLKYKLRHLFDKKETSKKQSGEPVSEEFVQDNE